MGVSVSFCFAGFSFSMIRSKLSMNLCVAATGALSTGGCKWKRCREELPHVRGQGQKLGGPHVRRTMAKRSYHTPEVRGSGRKCQAATAQEWLRGAALRLRSGAAGRRHPVSEVRGGDPRSHPSPRPGAAAGRSNPRSCGCVGTGRPRGAIPR